MVTLLQNRNYRLLWLAQVISGVGDVLYTVAIMVTIFQQSGSALLTAGVTVANALPPFVLGPFAGAVVDGHARRRVLVLMDLLRAGLVGLILLFGRQGELNIWFIYLIVSGLAAAKSFYDPAQLALTPAPL
ncbi:MAG: MFS transporter [Caldilineaceae bacterium]|nr:MFS transporter [Caldilineaceae bacterium]